ncbi:AAA-ATPase At2g18193-like [Jatropha curcas]|uniref:AAA-ATPase At2g18193-like n=1 Tax=Jatropha curcas TaxID=180498 RepID=UPI0018939A68|nr:AAA-ATPase At2g18193-like [Jatropha curcas]
MTKGEKVLKLYTRSRGCWDSIDFRHPSTFDALAMDHNLKKSIIDDIDRFLARKDYYKRIGKAWKRGYLLRLEKRILYLMVPPGTGKSSLKLQAMAMANYLKFDVFDLELANIISDADLRKAMLDINRKSITVIEDIDCNSTANNRSRSESDDSDNVQLFSLSGLLNCIDGLWSSCGEERIVVFTTNHKEFLDPALLRPGRMDMHIHMSYCTSEGFRVLWQRQLLLLWLLIQSAEATPASLAEELLKSDDPDVALGEVLNFLKQQKIKKDNEDKIVEETESSV